MTFNTDPLPHSERHQTYRELVNVAFDVSEPDPGFHAYIYTWLLDRMVLHDSDVGAQLFDRSASRMRQDHLEHYAMQLSLEGDITGDFDGRSVRVRPGEILFCDLSRPMRKRTSAVRVVTVGVARELIDAAATPSDDLHGLVLDAGRAGLLADHLAALPRRLPQLAPDALADVTRATTSLVAVALKPSLSTFEQARGEIEVLTLERAKRFVETQLASRTLTPEAICMALKVSRSALYRLFEPLGGVSQYIWGRRLARARAILSDPADGSRVSDIAFGLGFTSEAHFSRAFRKAYGVTPSELQAERRNAHSEILRPAAEGSDAHTFARWVKSLS
jgi:AraC-like DNA-binding protein